MSPSWKYSVLAVAAVITVPAVLTAQDTGSAAARRQAALVLDHTFNAPVGEPVRLFLAKGVTYRAEIQGNAIQLQLRPLMSSVQKPLIEPLLAGQSAGGESVYTIQPRADAEYEFITVGSPTGELDKPITLHVTVAPSAGPMKKP